MLLKYILNIIVPESVCACAHTDTRHEAGRGGGGGGEGGERINKQKILKP